jgi:erythromycin esterase-like protein
MLDALGRAQIVGIGEAAGGTYADALPKTLLVLALVHQVAIDTPNFEASRTGAEQLDAFLRSDRSDTTAVEREADCRG